MLQLNDKLNNLLPFKRIKRGLFDGLGSAIKYITGNMDNNDAKKINLQLKELMENKNNVNTDIKNQIILNTEMIERFSNITKHINNEQDVITKFLKNTYENISNKIYKEDLIISKIQYINRINYNIDLLINQISNIAESIVLAKINIISKFILSHNEIENIYNSLNNQIPEINSVEQIYEMLELQAYFNNSNIVFNIKIPIIKKESFILSHIIPLPINETRQIITPNYIVYNDKSINYYNDKCFKLENIYICKNPIKSEPFEQSLCLGKLIRNQQPRCDIKDVGRLETIYQPENNFVLFINTPLVSVESDCGKAVNITNTTLLFYENCTLTINGLIYEDKPTVYHEYINITLPKIMNVIPAKVVEELNLHKLKLFQFNDRKRMSSLEKTTTAHQYATYGSILIIILIIIGTSLCLKKKIQYIPTTNFFGGFVRAPSKSLWPSLYSKGGGVTNGNQPFQT